VCGSAFLVCLRLKCCSKCTSIFPSVCTFKAWKQPCGIYRLYDLLDLLSVSSNKLTNGKCRRPCVVGISAAIMCKVYCTSRVCASCIVQVVCSSCMVQVACLQAVLYTSCKLYCTSRVFPPVMCADILQCMVSHFIAPSVEQCIDCGFSMWYAFRLACSLPTLHITLA
jgi:hypothetical protein